MGLAVSGICAADASQALQAFVVQFPQRDGADWWSLSSASITGSVLSFVPVRNNSTRPTQSVMLQACDDVTPVFDPVAAGGIFALFFVSVVTTWLVSNNIGLILEAIKKW